MSKEERKEYQKAYYEAHKEQVKAYKKAHKEQIKAYQKAYKKANKEELKAYQKAYQKAHKEELKAYTKADVNSLGQTKDSIRKKSQRYLKKYGTMIPDYEIHQVYLLFYRNA